MKSDDGDDGDSGSEETLKTFQGKANKDKKTTSN